MKYPYSTTHYRCGCHIVEVRAGEVDLVESIYCEDYTFYGDSPSAGRRLMKCIYLPIIRMLRVRNFLNKPTTTTFLKGVPI